MEQDIRAVAFDVNGTLVDILTDEHDEQIYRALGHTLTYAGVDLRRGEVRDLYFRYLDEQRKTSSEEHPEFDVVAIFERLLAEHGTAFTAALPAARRAELPLFLAEQYRGVSRRRLELYTGVEEVLTELATRFPLAVVTDGQSAWARAELHQVGLLERFSPVVVSGDHGYRKPDPRLFALACAELGLAPEHVVYVGNDMHRDVFGARNAGMPTVMFVSGQGEQTYLDTVPDHMISDHRELLRILA
jgi:putative hydrolase of the HAD superfamily